MSLHVLTEAVGMSVGGINYVLSALVEKWLVKLGLSTAAAEKRLSAYLLTPGGLVRKAGLTRAFLDRKMEDCEAIKAEIAAIHVGLHETTAKKRS